PYAGRVTIRTSETHPIEVQWVEPTSYAGDGRLGLTYAPGKCGRAPVSGVEWRRELTVDMDRLRDHHGTDVLVSLMEPAEYQELLIPDLFAVARGRGIEVQHLPIVDGEAPRPEQAGEVTALLDTVRDALAAGKTVVIHCRGGQGRTGMMAAVLLTTFGHDAARAIATVREAQPKAVESAVQQAYVEAYVAARRE